MTYAYPIDPKPRQPLKVAAGIALAMVFLLGAAVTPASAEDHGHGGHGGGHGGHRGGHEHGYGGDHWDGGYDSPPPVVYGEPYDDGYGYPPPVVYAPGIAIEVPGIHIGIR